MSEHEIVLSFTDIGSGRFDNIAIVDRSGLGASALAGFLRYLADEMAAGSFDTHGAS